MWYTFSRRLPGRMRGPGGEGESVKRMLAALLLCVMTALFPLPGALCDEAEEWAQITAALASDEQEPVPDKWRVSLREDQLSAAPGLPDHIMSVLLLSSDAEEIRGHFGRAHRMMLCCVDMNAGKVQLISLPEGALLPVEGLPEEIRLKYAPCFGGPLLAVQTVNRWLKTNITRYCAVNVGAFLKAVDLLGGVTLTLTDSEAEAMELAPGENVLGGEQALRYVRLRRSGAAWDRPRKLLEALLAQASRSGADAALMLAGTLLPSIDTNLTTGELLNLIFALAGRLSLDRMETLALPAEDPAEASAWCRRVIYGVE